MEKYCLIVLAALLSSVVALSDLDCTLTQDDHYYDLRSLSEKDYWSYEEKSKYPNFNLNFYLSVCHPLRNLPSGSHCFDREAGVCVEQINKNSSQPLSERFMKVVTSNGGLVQSNSMKATSDGWLEYHYTDGTPCEFHGVKTNYTTYLNLLCPTHGAEESSGPVMMSNAGCVLTFAWLTEAACAIKLEKPKISTCMDSFNNSEEKLNLHSLHSATFYTASSILSLKKYQLNICGAIETGPCGGKNATVCDVSDPSNPVVISETTSMKVMWDGPYFSLKYFGESGTQSQKNVVVKFLCDRHAHNTTVYFISGNVSHIFFAARTTAVCTPKEHECVFKDRRNQVYDLRPLQKKEENWEVLDRREDHRDVLYHINLCGPVNPVGYYACPPGNVGACQTSLNKHAAYNLGYITSDPVVNSDGTITIIYTGGDPCKDGKHTRSTRIMLSCDKYAYEPVFIEETSTCEYVFSWLTPLACPRHVVESSTCQIQDPLYGFLYDLTPLRNMTQDYLANDGIDDFHVNLCGPVVGDYGGSLPADTSIVISKPSSVVLSGGQSPAKLMFNDGTLTMEFLNGSMCGETDVRSSQIIFLCDHEMEDPYTGLTVFRNSVLCQTSYVWRTKYACPPHTVIDCSVTADGYRYDLNPLSMPNLNQEEHGTDHNQKFVLNVCRSVVHSKSSRCAYDAAACLIDESNKNKSVNIGVLGNGPSIENGRLKLKYQNGDKCNATHRYSTEILFQCDEEDLFPYPHFVGQANCIFFFEWKTKQACREAMEPSSFGNCTATDVYRNYQYDLSPLKKSDLYEVSNGDVNLLLNVCGAVVDDRCPDTNSGACVKGPNQAAYTSGGVANAELMVIPGTLTLRYTNGSPCANGVIATTLISFFCGAEGAAEGPVLVSVDYDSCTYFVNWHTELACASRISCFAQGYDRAVDLRPLIQHKTNYEVAVSDTEKFYINVCRPLNHVQETTCTAGASACHVVTYSNGTSTSDSLGKPLMAPVYGHDDSVLILNTLGSQCRASPILKYSSRINFVCDFSAGKGSPRFVRVTDDCQYVFEWRTVFVCHRDAVNSSSCQTRHEPGKANLDLSALYKKEGYMVPFNGKMYLVNVCGSVCGNSGVCTESQESYGLSDSSHFKWDYNVLRLTYFSEESCYSALSGKRSSSIFFECDMSAGYGRPEADDLMEELPCMAVFTWKTNITCLESVYRDSPENSATSTESSIVINPTKSSHEVTVAPIITTSTIPFTNDTSSSRSMDPTTANSPEWNTGLSPGTAVLITLFVLGAVAAVLFYVVKLGLVHRLINRAKMSTATPRRGGMMLLDDTI
ncbi:Cation-independent mannose-6-phosphate receptor [Trinorchestia longiramus]|nr:Cation-independent mannose-6-phosphate receptor [Trinorchestia longiramus]